MLHKRQLDKGLCEFTCLFSGNPPAFEVSSLFLKKISSYAMLLLIPCCRMDFESAYATQDCPSMPLSSYSLALSVHSLDKPLRELFASDDEGKTDFMSSSTSSATIKKSVGLKIATSSTPKSAFSIVSMADTSYLTIGA
jgi:hypothetical protein